MDKLKKFDALYEMVKPYIITTNDIWSRLAGIEAILYHNFENYFWVGVYECVDDELIVRSYQGPIACPKLRHHVGVCWTSILKEESLIVANVDEFPGHIACSSISKSELVIPIRDKNGKVFACFDIDSDKLDFFDKDDEVGVSKLLSLLYWDGDN